MRRNITCVVVGALFAFLSSCGPEKPEGFDSFVPHVDVIVASTERGGGELIAWYDFAARVELPCQNLEGLVFCSSSAPGFAGLESDSNGLFPLLPGVLVALEIVDPGPGIRIAAGGVSASQPGERVLLGKSPELHAHVEWQFVGGQMPPEVVGEFRLSDASAQPRYQPSPTFRILFRLSRSTR